MSKIAASFLALQAHLAYGARRRAASTAFCTPARASRIASSCPRSPSASPTPNETASTRSTSGRSTPSATSATSATSCGPIAWSRATARRARSTTCAPASACRSARSPSTSSRRRSDRSGSPSTRRWCARWRCRASSATPRSSHADTGWAPVHTLDETLAAVLADARARLASRDRKHSRILPIAHSAGSTHSADHTFCRSRILPITHSADHAFCRSRILPITRASADHSVLVVEPAEHAAIARGSWRSRWGPFATMRSSTQSPPASASRHGVLDRDHVVGAAVHEQPRPGPRSRAASTGSRLAIARVQRVGIGRVVLRAQHTRSARVLEEPRRLPDPRPQRRRRRERRDAAHSLVVGRGHDGERPAQPETGDPHARHVARERRRVDRGAHVGEPSVDREIALRRSGPAKGEREPGPTRLTTRTRSHGSRRCCRARGGAADATREPGRRGAAPAPPRPPAGARSRALSRSPSERISSTRSPPGLRWTTPVS